MSEFRESANHVMPFGKHQGKTLDQIAETDQGLLYLDWLRGQLKPGQGYMRDALSHHLSVYLEDKAIAEELAKIVRKP